jgi:hypothetical protein
MVGEEYQSRDQSDLALCLAQIYSVCAAFFICNKKNGRNLTEW